jgi:hypothetical protein
MLLNYRKKFDRNGIIVHNLRSGDDFHLFIDNLSISTLFYRFYSQTFYIQVIIGVSLRIIEISGLNSAIVSLILLLQQAGLQNYFNLY